ncbi:MAG: TlpA disulfide reductase family protein, partial [Candidatus Cryptobacteroides sp.]|nr:TlpA disulfide reductase family protein [Bacteroidales bacterium]MDY6158857.1 TlpA disulfide reductase family protein [Candidatus Cryptobacteroides sp.]
VAILATGCKTVSEEQKVEDYQNMTQGMSKQFEEEYTSISEDASLTDEQKGEKIQACYDEYIKDLKAKAIKTIRKNPESQVALVALSDIRYDLEDAELEKVLDLLKGEIAEDKSLDRLKSALAARKATAEGMKFTDFTVDHVASFDKNDEPVYEKHSLSEFVGQGKVMLVDFWSPWCPPCKAEIPNIKKVWEKYHGEDFDVLSVAVWEESRRMNYRNTIDTAKVYGVDWLQLNNGHQEPASLYGIEGIPHMVLFDRDGTILKRGIRGEEVEEAVAEAIGR